MHGINASGPAARLATLHTYRARSENGEIPGRRPLRALTIPGAVDGWRLAHERFGRLALDELFDAAILYAREGVPVNSFAGHLARAGQANFERLFRDRVNRQELCRNATWPDRCRVRLDIDKVPAAYLSSIPTRVARLRATQLLLRHGSGQLDRFGYPVDLPRLWQRGRRRGHGHHPTKSRCARFSIRVSSPVTKWPIVDDEANRRDTT